MQIGKNFCVTFFVLIFKYYVLHEKNPRNIIIFVLHMDHVINTARRYRNFTQGKLFHKLLCEISLQEIFYLIRFSISVEQQFELCFCKLERTSNSINILIKQSRSKMEKSFLVYLLAATRKIHRHLFPQCFRVLYLIET